MRTKFTFTVENPKERTPVILAGGRGAALTASPVYLDPATAFPTCYEQIEL